MHSFFEKFTLIIFLILLKKIIIIGFKFDDDVHNITKRMDLETCLSQFDTHRNMIIRTEESLAIGGKYLQGIGLETVEECRRLCCETERCDVFVFEEKSEGYCYLFECGPPENFRCKFTKHGNFTSAVLTPIHHITETTVKPLLQQNIRPQSTQNIVSQQERELINLKQKLVQNPKDKITSTPLPINHLNTTPKTISATISTCGRFQFQCHSGECIGIYNACNGIPQCEDGSDEGPECNGNTGQTNSKSSGIVSGSNDLSMTNNRNDRIISKQNIIQTIPRQYQTQIVQSPIINNREDPMSAPQLWPPNRKISDSQVDLEPNIFSHKGGIQVPNVGQFSNQNPNVIYNQLPNQRLPSNVGNGIYLQPNDLQNQYRQTIIQPQDHIILQPNINWPVQQQLQQQQLQQSLQPGNPYGININGQLQPQSPSSIKITQETIDLPNPVQSFPAKNDQINSISGSDVPSPTQTEKVDKDNNQKVIDKNISKESEEYMDYTETSTEAPKKKQRKHKKTSKDSKKELKTENKVDPVEKSITAPYHGQYRLIKDNLEMEFVDHDGYSERPGGAVLSLTLGILVAAALAILIGCKMRTVGRRVRRLGKTPLASDADFLVNGMYL